MSFMSNDIALSPNEQVHKLLVWTPYSVKFMHVAARIKGDKRKQGDTQVAPPSPTNLSTLRDSLN